MKKKQSKPLGFIAEGGVNYYFGKNEIVSGYQYDYNNFTYIHTYGGIIYNFCNRGNLNVTAGPALGIEGGSISFWWGINLGGACYINEKIAITPGFILMEGPGSDPLFSCSIKTSLSL